MGNQAGGSGLKKSQPRILSDEALFQAYTRGDKASFEELVHRHKNSLFAYLARTVGDRCAAEDLFQETMERIVKSAGRFDPGQRFSVWAFRIATNLAIDWMRRRARERAARTAGDPGELRGYGARSDESSQRPALLRPEGRTATPEEILTAVETGRALEEAVKLLTEEQRLVFLLREEAGMPFREIAETLEAPLNTVLVRMHRALHSIRRHLVERGVLEGGG